MPLLDGSHVSGIVMPFPKELYGIRMAEVVTVLRGVEPGPYTSADLYALYLEACRAQGYAGGYLQPFGRVLAALDSTPPRYFRELRVVGRYIDPVALAERWPELGWS